jgi:hypothetical protein
VGNLPDWKLTGRTVCKAANGHNARRKFRTTHLEGQVAARRRQCCKAVHNIQPARIGDTSIQKKEVLPEHVLDRSVNSQAAEVDYKTSLVRCLEIGAKRYARRNF